MAPKPKLWDSVKVAKKFQKLKHLKGSAVEFEGRKQGPNQTSQLQRQAC